MGNGRRSVGVVAGGTVRAVHTPGKSWLWADEGALRKKTALINVRVPGLAIQNGGSLRVKPYSLQIL